jgi:hypothetical protein
VLGVFLNTLTDLFNQKSADQFDEEVLSEIEEDHSAQSCLYWVKTKRRERLHRVMAPSGFRFSRLTHFDNSLYAASVINRTMPKLHRQSKITVIWETVPDADPQAVHKAFSMLFRHPVNVGTELDSAESCEELPQLDKTH